MGKTATSYLNITMVAFILIFQITPVAAQPIRLKSGQEVEIIDGKIPEKVAENLYHEAEALFKKGRLDLAREYWQLLVEKAQGAVLAHAEASLKRAQTVEFSSFVILRNDQVLRGRVKADLRMDLVGLEGKDEIPLWEVVELIAEYHVGYSQVSKTFYPLTILEIRLRDHKMQTSRITREVEFVIEGEDGSATRAYLGKSYEILRPDHLNEQIEQLAADRILKVVIYPLLKAIHQ
jgi:uncharacterized protein (DUF2249 family)